MFLRAFAIWLLLFVLAEARNLLFLFPRLGSFGHIIRTVLLCSAIVLIAWFTVPWITPNPERAWAIGPFWLGCIVSFEFLSGGYRRGHRQIRPFTHNDIRVPGLWLLVLATALFAPIWVAAARQL